MTRPWPAPPEMDSATMHVVEMIPSASNVTVKVDIEGVGAAVHKPIRGEAPLNDFPEGTLAGREVASWWVSERGGWQLIPPTILREGPWGLGMTQAWVEPAPEGEPQQAWLDIWSPQSPREDWLPVVRGEDGDGQDVVVGHPDDPDLQSLALLDVVLNNADRKGDHLLTGPDGDLWAIDHGVTLHTDAKLRTVVWGFAGRELRELDLAHLDQLETALGRHADELEGLLLEGEVEALAARVQQVRAAGILPGPAADRYPLPWPLW